MSLPALGLQFSAFLAAVLPCALSETPLPRTPGPSPGESSRSREKLIRNSVRGTPSPSCSWYCYLVPPGLTYCHFNGTWVGKEVPLCLVHHLEPETHPDPSFLSLFYHMCFCCKPSQIFCVVRLDKT